MMADWQVGDLAMYLRLSDGTDPRVHKCAPHVQRPKRGAVYTVLSVIPHRAHNAEWIALGIDGPKSDWRDGEWNARSFVKVTPEKADEFDRETVALMSRVEQPA